MLKGVHARGLHSAHLVASGRGSWCALEYSSGVHRKTCLVYTGIPVWCTPEYSSGVHWNTRLVYTGRQFRWDWKLPNYSLIECKLPFEPLSAQKREIGSPDWEIRTPDLKKGR